MFSARTYLSPRWGLLNRNPSREEQPAFIEELCRRLADANYDLPAFKTTAPSSDAKIEPRDNPSLAIQAEEDTQSPTPNRSFERANYNPLPLGYAVWVLLVFIVVNQSKQVVQHANLRDGLALLAVSLAIRWFLSPWHLFNGADASYEKLLESIGMGHVLYGKGVMWLLNPLYGIVGEHANMLLVVNLSFQSCCLSCCGDS